MPRKQRPDIWLILPVTVLVVLGVVMIYSASAFVAVQKNMSEYHFLVRQLVWAGVGAGALLLALRVDYRRYRQLAWPVAILVLALLVAVLVPPLASSNAGVHRWLDLGPLAFQPSEVAKLGLTLFLAAVLARRRADLVKHGLRAFLPELAVVATCLVLVLLEPDLGTTLTLGVTLGALLFVGGLKLRSLGLICAAALPALGWSLMRNPYQLSRLRTAIDPWQDAQGKGYQAVQSFLALGRGGMSGTGPAGSRQKLFFLPEPHTDFILAVIGEELGFLGMALVITLFSLILWRGMRASLRAPDLFGTYLAFGLTFCIFLQAVINIGVVAGLLPTKGLTLPFLSYGGTSLVASLLAVGVILNISQHGVAPRRVE